MDDGDKSPSPSNPPSTPPNAKTTGGASSEGPPEDPSSAEKNPFAGKKLDHRRVLLYIRTVDACIRLGAG